MPSKKDLEMLIDETRKKRRWLKIVALIGVFGLGLRIGSCRRDIIYPPGSTVVEVKTPSRVYSIRVDHDKLGPDDKECLYRIALEGEMYPLVKETE